MTLAQLEKQHRDLLAKAREVYALAEKDKRDFSDEEWAELGKIDKDVAETVSAMEKARDQARDRNDLSDRIKAMFGDNGRDATEPPAQFKGTARTLGEMFTSSPEFKNWFKSVAPGGEIPHSARGLVSPPVQVQAIPGLFGRKDLVTGAGATSAGAMVETDYTGIYEPLGRYTLVMRDLISVRQTASDLVSFVRQTHQVTQATAVEEANVTTYSGSTGEKSGEKPEGTARWEEIQLPVQSIAVWIPATKRALADVPQLRGILDQELRDDVAEELEDQMINGTGLGANLTGVLNTAGILLQAWNTNILTTCRQAITTLLVTGRTMPTAFLFHPADWEVIDLTTDLQGQFHFGGPVRAGTRTLWGVPIAQSVFMPEGQAILADWRKAVLWDRQRATIQVSDSHADFFIRNMVAILCELRAAFGLISPDSFVVIDTTAGS